MNPPTQHPAPAQRPPRTPLVPPGGIERFERDMTATLAADVTLGAAQSNLAEVNQWLPIDGDPKETIGRLVEFNSTGPLRLGYGAWRDLLLGCQFINGRDRLISAGGRTMKNVAGYDLTKFMVGQGGIFGKITAVTVRTYRRPAGSLLAEFDPDVRILNRLLPTTCRPQWSILTASRLLCGYLGDVPSLHYWADRLRQPAMEPRPLQVVERSLADDIAHRAAAFCRPSAKRAFRAAVPPMRIAEFIAACRLSVWAADAAFGIVVGAEDEPQARNAGPLNRAFQAARDVGGSASYDCDGEYEGLLVRDPAVLKILQRLKQSTDPDGKLHPLRSL